MAETIKFKLEGDLLTCASHLETLSKLVARKEAKDHYIEDILNCVIDMLSPHLKKD